MYCGYIELASVFEDSVLIEVRLGEFGSADTHA